MIQRTAHWQLPSPYLWGVNYGLLYSTRFSELFIHKPGETPLQAMLATLLSPLVIYYMSAFVNTKVSSMMIIIADNHCLILIHDLL